MCYFDDGDGADVWDVTTPRAGKQHTCSVCGAPIVVGTLHDRIGILIEGAWSSLRVHQECHALARDIQLEACGQSIYYLEDIDVAHDVMEHMATHPDLARRWAAILVMRADEALEVQCVPA